jgi:phosphodiesterase/alkaline phosphatase D-like protein
MPRRSRFLLSVLCAFTSLFITISVHAASVGWAWVGGVTDSTAVITARVEVPGAVSLQLIENGKASDSKSALLAAPMADGRLQRFELAGLRPDTRYAYRLLNAEGQLIDQEPRSFRTFPAADAAVSFRFALGSCAKGVDSPVFSAATQQGARFFLHTGDFHYADIDENKVDQFRRAYDQHLSAPRLRTMLANMPLIYQWDDHDYGNNDSNASSPSRSAALQNYRELVPHYPLATTSGRQIGTDQSFSVGRVRFILSDLRSQRNPDTRRMMSAEQDTWLREQLLAARKADAPLIFWVSSVPWNGAPSKADRWQGYAEHRREITDFIKANGLAGRVVILSGDAHMTAIDDGRNADFATGGGAPIRVFQAGPIANTGSYKGGPYSHGARYKNPLGQRIYQFGMVDVNDNGKQIRVTLSGRDGADGIGNQVLIAERDAEGKIELEFAAP